MSSKDATFAIYRDQREIKVALHTLLKMGFNNSAVLALQSKRGGPKDFAQVQKSQFRSGALIGALIGSILFGGFFMFATEDLGTQRMLLTLFGIFIGGLFGAAAGTLVGIGTPAPAAQRYGQYLQSGGILLSVNSNSPEQVAQAQWILAETGGQDIQLINEFETWDKANLERIDLEKLQNETAVKK
jgi:hypothetical protein